MITKKGNYIYLLIHVDGGRGGTSTPCMSAVQDLQTSGEELFHNSCLKKISLASFHSYFACKIDSFPKRLWEPKRLLNGGSGSGSGSLKNPGAGAVWLRLRLRLYSPGLSNLCVEYLRIDIRTVYYFKTHV